VSFENVTFLPCILCIMIDMIIDWYEHCHLVIEIKTPYIYIHMLKNFWYDKKHINSASTEKCFLKFEWSKIPETLIPVKVTFLCHRIWNLHAGKEIMGPTSWCIILNSISYYFDDVCLQSIKSNSYSMKPG